MAPKRRRRAKDVLKERLLELAKSRCKILRIESVDAQSKISLRGRVDVAEALAKNRWLRCVNFDKCEHMSEKFFSVLMLSNTIDTLHVNVGSLSEKVCTLLASSPHLISLHISGIAKSLSHASVASL
jgi:hypothetical protein